MNESIAQREPRYPRLLRRVRAVLLDSVVISAIIVSWWLTLPLLENVPPLARIAYPILAILLVDPVMVSLTGATPGHHIMGVTIRDAKTGEKIGLLRAILRSVLRGLFGWLSLAFVLTTRKYQALHDLACRTTVLLLEPESVPSHESFAERSTAMPGYAYPSKTRRALVILAYFTLIPLLVSSLGILAYSDGCLQYGDCNTTDTIVVIVLNLLFFLGIGATIVLGWTARLFGCRRTKCSDNRPELPG